MDAKLAKYLKDLCLILCPFIKAKEKKIINKWEISKKNGNKKNPI